MMRIVLRLTARLNMFFLGFSVLFVVFVLKNSNTHFINVYMGIVFMQKHVDHE